MSTILKALKRLEHDKQAEAARNLTHDPLAPALKAPDEPAPRRSLAGPIALAAAAAIIGAGLSYGLASWWFSQGQNAGAPDVAAGSAPAARPLAAIPPAARASAGPDASGRAAASPAGGVEPVGSADVSSPAPAGGTPEPSSVFAQARPPSPDPWEEMARAPASDGGSTADEKGAASSASASGSASSTASSGASSSASSGPRAASSPASSNAVTPRRPEPAPGGAAATPATRSSRSSARAASGGARPVSSLPEVSLPEPVAAPPPAPPAVAPAKKPAPAPERATEPAAPVEPTRPEPVVAAVQIEQPETRIEVFVVKTVWHPKPERRSARLRLSDRVDTVEVHEEDVVEGYVVREITPSSVVLARGDVVVTHRVGR